MADRECPLEAVPLPAEVRESLAELELELSEGDITQKGYEKKRAKLLARYIPLIQGVDPSLQAENRIPGPSQTMTTVPKQQKPRPTNSRDERFRSDVHTEAVQAALAKYKERKMPMPSKRRSVLVHSSVETYTPPDLHSAPPDVTTGLVEHSHCERPQLASVRGVPRGYSGSILETAGGEHASLFFKQQSTGSLLRY
nr:PREDICTED: disco-interacting protein 2 homolog A-like isoform X4 [Equus przewalskii]